MAESATVFISAVDEKDTSTGKKVYQVKDGNNRVYATFKAEVANHAKPLVGKQADITYTVKQKDQYTNYYLDSIEPHAAPAHQANGGGGGGADKGLHITRTALWKSYFEGGLAEQAWITSPEKTTPAQHVVQVGLVLVQLAEADIYGRGEAQPGFADPDEDIPF